MAKTGRPSKSKAEHKLHGDPGNRHGKKDPEKKGGKVYRYIIPSYLSKDLEKHAKDVVDELYRLGKSKLIYQSIFDGWCQHLCLRDKAFEELTDDKLIVKGERGINKKNPAIQTHKDFSASTLKHAEHLGLSGLTSDRIRGESPKKGDALEDFLDE